jgi:hypothetical protein
MALELMACSNNLSLKHPAQVIAMTGEAGEQEVLENKPAAISRDETWGEPLGRNLTNQRTSTAGRSSLKSLQSPITIENKQYTEF